MPSSSYYPIQHHPISLYLSLSIALKIDSITHPIPPFLYPPNSYHYSLVLPPFSTISLHFYPSTSSIVENVEKPVENLLKILNHIQILFNYCLNIQEMPIKPSLYILCTQIIIRLGDLTYIFFLNTSTSI